MPAPYDASEHLFIELWEDKEGNLGWSISQGVDESLDAEWLQRATLEFAEWVMAIRNEANPVIYTLMVRLDGLCLTRQAKDHDFSRRQDYVAMRVNSYRSMWYILDEPRTPSNLRVWMWNLEWAWHLLSGHFKAHRALRLAGATPVPAKVTDMLSEHSEASEAVSQPLPANVVRFRKIHNHDQRPL